MSSTPYSDVLVETIEACRDASPAEFVVHYNWALEYIDHGRYSEALVCLERAKALEQNAGNAKNACAAIQALALANSE